MEPSDLEKLVTDVVNAAGWRRPLDGLSTEAIQTWAAANRIDPHAMLAELVYRASELFGVLLERDIAPEERIALANELRTVLVSIDAEVSPGNDGDDGRP